MLGLFALIVGFLIGLVVADWLLKKRMNELTEAQVKQTRQITEEMEKAHQERLQKTVESLQSDKAQLEATIESVQAQHQTHVDFMTQELESQHQNTLQNRLESLQEEYENRVHQLTDELQLKEGELREKFHQLTQEFQTRESEIRESLKSIYEEQLSNLHEELERRETQLQGMLQSLEAQYLIQLREFKEKLGLGEEDEGEETIPQKESPQKVQSFNVIPVPQETSHKEIIQWGDSRQLYTVPLLKKNLNSTDNRVRELTALSLGKIAESHGLRPEIQTTIPWLGKLSQDFHPAVRQQAVKSLGMIKSESVIPFLQRALYDHDAEVVKAAHESLTKFKGYQQKINSKVKKYHLRQPPKN